MDIPLRLFVYFSIIPSSCQHPFQTHRVPILLYTTPTTMSTAEDEDYHRLVTLLCRIDTTCTKRTDKLKVGYVAGTGIDSQTLTEYLTVAEPLIAKIGAESDNEDAVRAWFQDLIEGPLASVKGCRTKARTWVDGETLADATAAEKLKVAAFQLRATTTSLNAASSAADVDVASTTGAAEAQQSQAEAQDTARGKRTIPKWSGALGVPRVSLTQEEFDYVVARLPMVEDE
ncbi:uncharacterized protein MKK02DRAFT_31382 [Dioszegia hungarica]|uniref:Uncharacterized protein n=1 Tax=Dioszegia hungarica TaxID=4972 RepID=A0AA38HD29_9TREE|nr:uncharacterized protein MKK02DRAFT_31382 [Dioszegia hungarica]KAI9637822.1 hypothetical protein MKK02DRAFT_31382 [Dioszegia hungarica]